MSRPLLIFSIPFFAPEALMLFARKAREISLSYDRTSIVQARVWMGLAEAIDKAALFVQTKPSLEEIKEIVLKLSTLTSFSNSLQELLFKDPEALAAIKFFLERAKGNRSSSGQFPAFKG